MANAAEIEIAARDTSTSAIWDHIVETSKNGTFLHKRDYINHHAHRFEEESVIALRRGIPVAVFPCNKVSELAISHGGLTYGGLIYGHSLKAIDVLAIMELLAKYYRNLGCTRLIYKAVPHVFHRYPSEEDLYALYRLGARLVRRDLSTIVQMKGRPRLSELRRRAAKKAAREGLEVREGPYLKDLHPLIVKSLSAHNTQPVHSLEELDYLRAHFPQGIRVFGTYRSEQMVAGTVVYDFGHVAHTQYLASSEEGRAHGGLDLLITKLLDEEFLNHQFLSFGISTEQQGRHLNEGLIFQKEGFGGRAVIHDFYELEL